MSFRCGITGKAAPNGTKPIVVRYLVKREYSFYEEDPCGLCRGRDPDCRFCSSEDYIVKTGVEIVREVLVHPDAAPAERDILLPGVRSGAAGDPY